MTNGSQSLGHAALSRQVGRRAAAALCGVALLSAIGIGLVLAELARLRSFESQLTASAMPYERLLSRAALAARTAAIDERSYRLTGDEQYLRRMRKVSDPAVFAALDAALQLHPAGSIHSGSVRSIREDYEAWMQARDAGLESAADAPAAAMAATLENLGALGNAYEKGFDRAIELSQAEVQESHERYNRRLERAQQLTVLFASVALLVAALLFAWMMRSTRRDYQQVRATAEREAAAYAFEHKLKEAMEMAERPEEVHGVVAEALPRLAEASASELLLADSSEAHLTSVASSIQGAGCPVSTMWSCPAIRRGRRQTSVSSVELDACPRLREAGGPACSAVCTPVMFMGKAMGVLHTRGADGRDWHKDELVRIRQLAAEAGTRLGLLKTMAQTELQASTDSLTGMANRRTLEAQVRDLIRRRVPYVVAMGDLDSFKTINDTYGHDSGDRAIRRFGRVLRQLVRKDDIVARYGGDEFVLVFPEMPEAATVALLDRVRHKLAEQDADDHLPSFTASFGVSSSGTGTDFKAVLDAADQALLQAKRAGRNRVICAGDALLLAAVPDRELKVVGGG